MNGWVGGRVRRIVCGEHKPPEPDGWRCCREVPASLLLVTTHVSERVAKISGCGKKSFFLFTTFSR
jgi:hypothetical protein